MERFKHTVIRVVFVAAAVAAFAACSQGGGNGSASATADSAKFADDIKAQEAQWSKDFGAKALEGAVGPYSHDAMVMNPGAPVLKGSDAIRAGLTDAFTDANFKLSFAPDKVVVSDSGDMAYSVGKYDQTVTDPKTHAAVHSTGSYVTVYKRASNGAWKAAADITTPGPATP
jgi:ketosteroid isomerase-like protein